MSIFWYDCVRVCTHVDTCVDTRISKYTSTTRLLSNVNILVRLCSCMHAHTWIHAWIHVYAQTCMCMHLCVYVSAYACTHVDTRMRANVYAYAFVPHHLRHVRVTVFNWAPQLTPLGRRVMLLPLFYVYAFVPHHLRHAKVCVCVRVCMRTRGFSYTRMDTY